MSQLMNYTRHHIDPASLGKRMLIGAVLGLFLISLFLMGDGDLPSDPEWPKYWYIRPFIVVPIAAAMGAGFSCILDDLRHQGGWKQAFAIVFSLIVFIVSLWLGTVLGLAGTLWN